jgi:glucokinase-like ROK family protein
MTWNQQVVKANNKQQILELIISQAPLSRADISNRLGLTKGTISSLVNELIDANLCYESGPGESSGGRRPVMLLFNEQAGYSIGIDLGVNYILGVLTDLKGQVVTEQRLIIKSTKYDEALILVKRIIHSLLNSVPNSPYGVVGIGVGVPGIVNKEGLVLLAPNLDWKNIHLKQDLEIEFNLPVMIENEANAGAYGEKKFGSGKPYENLIYISAGIGIGVGFILNNELYKGSEGFSGEMGHMIIEADGKACSCGSRGCWEQYASEKSLIHSANELLGYDEDVTLEYLVESAKDSSEIQNLFINIGKYLGIGINNISNTFNPQQIIIGNRLSMAKKWITLPIQEFVRTNTLKYDQRGLEMNYSTLSTSPTALGASAQVIENFLHRCIK